MEQTARKNERGMSLIEVLFAMVLLMIVGIALTQTALVGQQENLKNVLRDEAVLVAEQTMNDLRSRSFNDSALATGVTTSTVTRDFRSFHVDYTVKRTIADVTASTRQAIIEVSWPRRGGGEYKHTIVNFVRIDQ